MFTCLITYEVDPTRLDELRAYARAWIRLIEKYGGTHHGYFVPADASDELPSPAFSFPGLGRAGSENTAVALFSFPDVQTYDDYRREVAHDEACIAATERFNASPCFLSYERNFLKPIFE